MMRKIYLLLLILPLLFTCVTPKKAHIDTPITKSKIINDSCYDTPLEVSNSVEYSEDGEVLGNSGSPAVGESYTPEMNTPETIIKKKNVSQSIDLGEVVYKVPDTMIVFTTYKITVRISKKSGTIDITENLDGKITKSSIKTSSKMEVMLVDPNGDSSFKIKQINNDQQVIDSLGYTEWIFSVTPLKSGNRSLNLVISIISSDGKKQKVYNDVVHIKSSISKEATTFWNKYWQWLFTTFLIPIFVFIWKRKNKKD
jgi:hypothetical protein